jgi:hypothetical protein
MASYTRPNAAQQVWWLRCVLAAASTVDAVFIHALTMAHATTTVTVYVSDDSTDDAVSTIDADLWDGGGLRLFEPCMQKTGDSAGQQRQWTGATVIKIKFDAGVGHNCRPQVTEVVAGQQRQLAVNPLYPYDPYASESVVEQSESKAGVVTTYKEVGGRKVVEADFKLYNTTQAGIINSLWDDTDKGTRPVVWCPNPSTDPNRAWLLRMAPALALPRRGPNEYGWQLKGIEQGGSLLCTETIIGV